MEVLALLSVILSMLVASRQHRLRALKRTMRVLCSMHLDATFLEGVLRAPRHIQFQATNWRLVCPRDQR
jgi:hypothetical protein